MPRTLTSVAYIAAYFFGGYYTVTEVIEKIRASKFEIDFLMIVAAAGAASLGAWAEGALLLFLFSIGHALEGYAMGRAKRAIEALSELAQRTARVRRDGTEKEVPVKELVVGDIVVIKPDVRVPADGFVIVGESSIIRLRSLVKVLLSTSVLLIAQIQRLPIRNLCRRSIEFLPGQSTNLLARLK